jgi:hypothetical protein
MREDIGEAPLRHEGRKRQENVKSVGVRGTKDGVARDFMRLSGSAWKFGGPILHGTQTDPSWKEN